MVNCIPPTNVYWALDLPLDFRSYRASYRTCATPGGRGAHNGTGGDMSVAVLSTNRPRLARQVRLQWDPVRERQVLLEPEGVLVLNQTGATILGLCDGERTVVEIVEELRGRYNHVAGDEVRDFLTRLVAKRLVELGDG
ncbi:MAG TPA: pyrroloquinoline quinone biosynthesis peptide chaperone PqqD [Rubrobacteraceae bacterium]